MNFGIGLNKLILLLAIIFFISIQIIMYLIRLYLNLSVRTSLNIQSFLYIILGIILLVVYFKKKDEN